MVAEQLLRAIAWPETFVQIWIEISCVQIETATWEEISAETASACVAVGSASWTANDVEEAIAVGRVIAVEKAISVEKSIAVVGAIAVVRAIAAGISSVKG
eukprot:gb/GFBE01017411.1/.p1 GENE.gb/GFBE01017411.1/~~gb/GFBE01017411.1/.p1  ORF type:complete len:101 (+),score=7.60 gb/GFBE01017411.1/:1-303(+)